MSLQSSGPHYCTLSRKTLWPCRCFLKMMNQGWHTPAKATEVVPRRKEMLPVGKEALPLQKELQSVRKEVLPLRKEVLSARKEVLPPFFSMPHHESTFPRQG